jgi:hypothetical protein
MHFESLIYSLYSSSLAIFHHLRRTRHGTSYQNRLIVPGTSARLCHVPACEVCTSTVLRNKNRGKEPVSHKIPLHHSEFGGHLVRSTVQYSTVALTKQIVKSDALH